MPGDMNHDAGLGLDARTLRHVFDALDAGLCVIELLYRADRPDDYLILATNGSFERHSGLVGVEGMRIRDAIGFVEDHWLAAYDEVVKTGRPTRVVNESAALGRWFEVSASRLGGEGSRKLVVLFTDVTERRKAEQALKDAQDRLEGALAAVEIATWIWDIQKDAIIADRNLARLLGVSSRDAHGGPLSAYLQRIHPEDRALVEARIAATLAVGEGFEAEYRIVRDDSTRWVIARGNVEFDAGGRPTRLVGVVLDVTTQRAAERALRRNEERLQLALHAGHMGAWDLDLTTGTMQCTPACKANYGRNADEPFSYEDLRACVADEDRERWESTVAQGLRTGEFEVEYRVVWPDGSRHWVYVRGSASRMRSDGPADALSGISILVDEKKRTEEALRAADRHKDEFLATASHELRTPLTAILGWARLLRGGRADANAYARGLEVIERNALTQVRLIEDILDGSRVISGKLKLELQAVDVAELVASATEVIRPSAEAKQIHLRVSLDPQAGAVSGDADRLQQVVWNLTNNAIKFTPRGGHVDVALRREGANVELVVSDTGQGIAPSLLPHVFERFRQGEGSTTRRHGGLGLGLALVKYLAEAHGGTVRAESAGPGQGATFTVRLPLRSVAHASAHGESSTVATGSSPHGTASSLAGVMVLVVDDEADTRELVATVLRSHGADVRTAESAEAALAALGASWPRVLVSDVAMPAVDGYELIRRVRSSFGSAGARLAALALTAYSREEDRRRALRSGFDAYLAKPVELEVLVEAVHRMAELPGGAA